MRYLALLLVLICGSASAHQWTPSHVELRPSYVGGIHTATMKFYNSRDDVEYYQVQVTDGQFNPIKFAISGGQSDVFMSVIDSTRQSTFMFHRMKQLE